MMKFFRKYNKHLLAVFMALLLVIWLGGQAIEEMFAPDPGKMTIGTAVTGKILQRDRDRAEFETNLLANMGIDWRSQFGNPFASSQEQLEILDYVLLQREAEHHGIQMDAEQAKARLVSALARAGGQSESAVEQRLRTVAARLDVAPERLYEAAANYFEIERMYQLMESSLDVPEPLLRLRARDRFEKASIEVVTFPAETFADPTETFSEEELQAHFEEYKDDQAGEGLNFGYYIEPAVDIQYIAINPDKIKEHLSGDEESYELRAFRYWQDNKTNFEFRRSQEEMEAARAKQADATTNGEQTTQPAPVSPYYENFAEAREKAIDHVKTEVARSRADEIARTLSRLLAEPWFDIVAEPTEYKPAPDRVKNLEYYQEVVEALPTGLQFPEGIEIVTTNGLSRAELNNLDGIGQAMVSFPDGSTMALADLAFMVEGFAEIPEDARVDRNLYTSRWQTQSQPLRRGDGRLYLFRVVDTHRGHAPESLDVVRDDVIADLRLVKGMERAVARAEEFAKSLEGRSLNEAWNDQPELIEQITPEKGGYLAPPPFARSMGMDFDGMRNVPRLGMVPVEFVEEAFELAAKGPEAEPAVVRLPRQAKVAVVQGKEILPLYEEDFEMRRDSLRTQLMQQNLRSAVLEWRNASTIRSRNNFKVGDEA